MTYIQIYGGKVIFETNNKFSRGRFETTINHDFVVFAENFIDYIDDVIDLTFQRKNIVQ